MQKKILNLHHWLFLSLIAGAVLGLIFQPYQNLGLVVFFRQNILELIGQVFLRLIFMVVVPMVFCGLCLGVFELSSHSGLGRVIRQTIALTIVTSTCSVLLGVGLVNFFQPGKGFDRAQVPTDQVQSLVTGIETQATQVKTWKQILLEIIPVNPLKSAVFAMEGEMLSLMFFAICFGIALGVLQQKKKTESYTVQVLEEVYAICMHLIDKILLLAPVAVLALVFSNVNRFGIDVIIALGSYVLVVLGALSLQQFGVYPILLYFGSKMPIRRFYSQTRDVLLYAFATSSSNATLPKTLEVAEQDLKLHPQISRFVLTAGSTLNQNGTALFEGVTVLFLAQVYGIELSLHAQFTVVLLSVLAGVGTAGVPGGSLPLVVLVMRHVGIPVEGIGIILGVDRLLDMSRTVVNVTGDLVIASVVSANDPEITSTKKKKTASVSPALARKE